MIQWYCVGILLMLKHGLMPPSGALEKNNFNTHSKTGERQGTPPFDILCLPFLSINYRK